MATKKTAKPKAASEKAKKAPEAEQTAAARRWPTVKLEGSRRKSLHERRTAYRPRVRAQPVMVRAAPYSLPALDEPPPLRSSR